MTSLHWLRGAGSGPPYTPTHPPSLRLPSSLAHPRFDKRDTEFIRRLRSNCLQAIFTLFAFITSLMRLIMGLLCGAGSVCFSSRLPVFHRICFPPPQLLLSPHILNILTFYYQHFIFSFYYLLNRFNIVWIHML